MVGVLVTATASCNFLSTTAKVHVATAHGDVAEASFLLTAGDLGRWFGNLERSFRATGRPFEMYSVEGGAGTGRMCPGQGCSVSRRGVAATRGGPRAC